MWVRGAPSWQEVFSGSHSTINNSQPTADATLLTLWFSKSEILEAAPQNKICERKESKKWKDTWNQANIVQSLFFFLLFIVDPKLRNDFPPLLHKKSASCFQILLASNVFSVIRTGFGFSWDNLSSRKICYLDIYQNLFIFCVLHLSMLKCTK